MVTLVGTQNNEKDLVESLLNLEHDAQAAYRETIERLDDRALSQQVSAFLQDHMRHTQELSAYAAKIGAKIPDGTAKAMMTSGKVKMADMIGDNAICMAMKTNEQDTVTAYERASTQDFVSPELKAICEKAYADETRHREWFGNASASKKAA